MNVQVIADAAGRLVWASAALPGSTHDLTAARTHNLIDALTGADVMSFADKAYQGAGSTVRTPFKRHRYRPKLSARQKAVNKAHARIRARGEPAAATLKTWKLMAKLRCSPPGRPRSCRPSSLCTPSRTRSTEVEKRSMEGDSRH